ncbi:uroporphyrinogen decarboxylase family protein [Acetobacterium wieringae]|uniref:Methylcobalamin:coenzyme M methyltransferase n=1 Tax=Acetobacterium wieringae TaxID=52694 RepID=A0A1F2PD45_9FIRM|nr:uroporphyrinogen decarboxylase family protein [Acetobacterium wieringae]OFV68944.1 methylcobalamin:coenzyme M methyltransferase [Acetobacterium wieringae]
MGKINFKETELQGQGMYEYEGTWYGLPYAPVERLMPPISPAENFKRCLDGKAFEWIPDGTCDMVDITPHCIPDVDASDYEGGIDTFGVKWVALENGLPAMVEPGKPALKDISEWKNLAWPDVSSWDWENFGKRYQEKIGTERIKRGVMLSSYFERLISLMDFEGAAMALVEDPEEVEEFFNKLTDYHIEVVNHYKKYFDVDVIMAHDDWAAQRSPFFSINTVRALLVPQYKRFVQHCHNLGIYFTLHSCGNGKILAPAMIEAGIDSWQLQQNAMDLEEVVDLYGDALGLEAYFEITQDDEAAKQFIIEQMRLFSKVKKPTISFYDMKEERSFDVRRFIYEEARKAALTRSN